MKSDGATRKTENVTRTYFECNMFSGEVCINFLMFNGKICNEDKIKGICRH